MLILYDALRFSISPEKGGRDLQQFGNCDFSAEEQNVTYHSSAECCCYWLSYIMLGEPLVPNCTALSFHTHLENAGSINCRKSGELSEKLCCACCPPRQGRKEGDRDCCWKCRTWACARFDVPT